jgi:hypothetical protein
MVLSFMPCTTNLLRVEGVLYVFCCPVIAFGVYWMFVSYHWTREETGFY